MPGLLYGHTHLLREFGWEAFNHSLYIPDLAPCDFHLFLSSNSCPVSISVFRITVGNKCQRFFPMRQTSTQDIKVGPWNDKCLNSVGMLKNSSTLAVSVSINFSIKLGFVSVNGPREAAFFFFNSRERLLLIQEFSDMLTECVIASTFVICGISMRYYHPRDGIMWYPKLRTTLY